MNFSLLRIKMQIAKNLKEKLNRFELTLGILATEHIWPGMVELLQGAGLDYLMIDMEHGPHTDEAVAQVCDTGRQVGMPIFIRPVSTEFSIVRRAIDLGPCGLMFPTIETVEQLEQIKESVWMPPRGRRRPGGVGNHWMRDFNYKTWREEFEDHLIILAQIESMRGVENIDAIASHEVVTSLALGPYDLSADLGCCWEPENPKLLNAMEKVREAGQRHGKNTWCLGDGPSLKERGFSFICIGESSIMMKIKSQEIVQELRGEGGIDMKKLAAEHG